MLKTGDEVKYTSGCFGDSESNPLWGGDYGNVVGVIIDIYSDRDLKYGVRWGEHNTNQYSSRDLVKLHTNDWVGGKRKRVRK